MGGVKVSFIMSIWSSRTINHFKGTVVNQLTNIYGALTLCSAVLSTVEKGDREEQ